MINKKTWKIGSDRDKMEILIKYHVHVKYQKKILFEKENTFFTVKQSTAGLIPESQST